MDADGTTTSQQLYVPTLLVIGACEALVARCRHAAQSTGLAIKACSPREAAETVPLRHPLAMVVPNDVFDRAPHDLEALARDVRSVLLRVDPEVSVRELEAMMAAAIDGCSSQRERRVAAGRYSMVDGIEEEAPFSRPSAPPSLRAPRSSPVPTASPASVRAPRSSPVPTASPASVRTPRSSPVPTASPASVRTPRGPLAPGVASTRPARLSSSSATEPPPTSAPDGTVMTSSFAAIRAIFPSR